MLTKCKVLFSLALTSYPPTLQGGNFWNMYLRNDRTERKSRWLTSLETRASLMFLSTPSLGFSVSSFSLNFLLGWTSLSWCYSAKQSSRLVILLLLSHILMSLLCRISIFYTSHLYSLYNSSSELERVWTLLLNMFLFAVTPIFILLLYKKCISNQDPSPEVGSGCYQTWVCHPLWDRCS